MTDKENHPKVRSKGLQTTHRWPCPKVSALQPWETLAQQSHEVLLVIGSAWGHSSKEGKAVSFSSMRAPKGLPAPCCLLRRSREVPTDRRGRRQGETHLQLLRSQFHALVKPIFPSQAARKCLSNELTCNSSGKGEVSCPLCPRVMGKVVGTEGTSTTCSTQLCWRACCHLLQGCNNSQTTALLPDKTKQTALHLEGDAA